MSGTTSGEQPNQTWDPARYARNARFVADLGMPVVEWLAPRPREVILDLGCGDGPLTQQLAAMCARVVGVDASPQQIAAARARGLDARVMDGAALAFSGEFDAVFSNAALHWMKQPDLVIAGVARALKPGGRFVGEMGGAGNVAAIEGALIAALERRGFDGRAASPWYFPSPAEYRGKLEAAGFVVVRMEHFARPTKLPGEMAAWLDTFAEPFLGRLPAAGRAAAVAEVVAALRPALCDAAGGWTADYVRLRFEARLG